MAGSGGLVVKARRLDMPGSGNSCVGCSLIKWLVIVGGLEAATNSLIGCLLSN
jgi:hypothetical protein